MFLSEKLRIHEIRNWVTNSPDRRVIGLQTELGEQLFDIAERQRVPKIPAHGTKDQLRRRLRHLKFAGRGAFFHDLFRLPAIHAKVATHLFKLGENI
jgi:hypothetical protein